MIESNGRYCMCSLNGIMDILGKKWVIFVLNGIGTHGKVRFGELYKELKGVSPSTLSWILKELTDRNILKREIFPEIPPRVEYALTETGVELRNSIIPLLKWAAKYDNEGNDPNCCGENQYVTISQDERKDC
ncbi:MAG: winged helix-turn-helix transcriptional regulator [Thermoplasmata archaeon]